MLADQPRGPTRLLAHTAAALVFGAALVFALRACAHPAIVMDGGSLIETLARAEGRLPLYDHALYLPLGALVEFFVGDGRSLDALSWLSILSGGATCVIAALVLAREFGTRPAGIAVAAFASAPAFWFMSTNVEVHATQALGGAVVLWAALAATRARTPRAAIGIFAALLFATLVHNSNVMLVLGPAWVAARRGHGAIDMRRLLVLALASGSGGVIGLFVDDGARRLAGGVDRVRLDRLVTDFAQPLDLHFLQIEVVRAWFPVLVLVAWSAPRSRAAWRAAWPFLAGALPACVVFVASAINSVGGYFGSAVLFVLAAGLAAQRASNASAASAVSAASVTVPRPAALRRFGPPALFAAVCLVGCHFGVNDASSTERARLAEVGRQRYALASRILPAGGLFASLDPDLQVVSGRGLPLHDLPIGMALGAALGGAVSEADVFAELEARVARCAVRDEPLAFNVSWRGWAERFPQVVAFHERLLELCERHYRFEARDLDGIPFLVGVPRTPSGSS